MFAERLEVLIAEAERFEAADPQGSAEAQDRLREIKAANRAEFAAVADLSAAHAAGDLAEAAILVRIAVHQIEMLHRCGLSDADRALVRLRDLLRLVLSVLEPHDGTLSQRVA